MVIHVGHEVERWQNLVEEEERSGKIPLPAVDTIHFNSGRTPSVLLIAPGTIEGSDEIYVDVEGMNAGDRVAIDSLLGQLRSPYPWGLHLDWIDSIFHCGGLEYEFQGARMTRLSELDPPLRPLLWGLLHAIAEIGAKYPDLKASLPG